MTHLEMGHLLTHLLALCTEVQVTGDLVLRPTAGSFPARGGGFPPLVLRVGSPEQRQECLELPVIIISRDFLIVVRTLNLRAVYFTTVTAQCCSRGYSMST